MAPKKALPDGNLALKCHYRTGIRLSKIITGREFGSQKSLPDENLALKNHYRTRIGLSNIITGHEFGCQYLLNKQTFGSVLEGLGWSWRVWEGPKGSRRPQEGREGPRRVW